MAKKSKKNSSMKLLVVCCELVLAIVALVLLFATSSVVYTYKGALTGTTVTKVSGTVGMFGGTDANYAMPWAGMTSFILLACAIVILVLLFCLSLAKKKFALAGICKFVAAGLLIVAGVLLFFEVSAWTAVNGNASFAIGTYASGSYSLGAGWLIAGIVSIVAGGLSCAEAFLF
jgi:glucan phosphoethanolaminetransferase (alkaline phosphatase superfamily)